MAVNLNQERADRPAVTYWRSERVPNGTSLKCWCAGRPIFLNTHRVGVSKPCLSEISGGDLACPWCAVIAREYLGYCPWYTIDAERIVTVVREDMKPRALAMRLHEPVTVSRAKRMTAAVRLSQDGWTTTAYSGPPDRMQPACIFDWLLRLWKIPELTAYVEQQRRTAPPAPPVDAPVIVTDHDALTKGGGEILADQERDKMRSILRRRAKLVEPEPTTERNGTHAGPRKPK